MENFLEPNYQNENPTGLFLESENNAPQDLEKFSAESNQETIAVSTFSDDDIILSSDFPGIIHPSSSLSSEGKEDILGKSEASLDTGDELTGGIKRRNGNSSDPGNNKRKAYDIGTLTDGFNIDESVGKKDKRDFYKLTVEEETEIVARLKGLTGNADLYLEPQKGKVIDKSRNGGKRDEEISATLEPGTYYFRVQPRNNKVKNADYNFDLEIVESASVDPGNSKGKAFEIVTLSDGFNIEESVGKKDQRDFYKLTVEEETEVEIKLTDLTANADVYLLPQKGNKVIDKSRKGGKRDEIINATLEPDTTYYLRVQPRNNRIKNANYNLGLEIVESETAESDLERFEFTYYYKGNKNKKNQDFYNGYVYAPTGTYEVGSYFDFNEEDNQAGANGKYYIYDSSAAEKDAQEGEVYLETYYNVENDKNYNPYYASGGLASGIEGLGSEQDFIGAEFSAEEEGIALSPKAFFGADNYVADIVQEARISGSGDYQIDALLSGLKWGTDEITYSFYDDSNGGQYYGAERNVGEVSEKVKKDVRHILENIFDPLLDVDFVEVEDSSSSYGLIRVMKSNGPKYAYAYYPFADDSNVGNRQDLAGDVHLKLKYDGSGGTNNFQGGPGSHGYLTLIHELGHAVGLKHPHEGKKKLPEAEDNTRNTVMSYNFDFKAETLMPYDVKALQYMYGADGTFEPYKIAYREFTVGKGGWSTQDKYPRQVADVNGDGRGDIVGFGQDAVYVALGKTDGTFEPYKIAYREFVVGKGGWSTQDKYPRQLADVNGDNRADIVGFGQDEVYVSLGKTDGTFEPYKIAYREFVVGKGGWSSQDKYPRQLADVDGDGRADIVGFGQDAVYVAIANG